MWLTIIFCNSDFHIGIVLSVAYWAIEKEFTAIIDQDGELDSAIQGYFIACNGYHHVLYAKMKNNCKTRTCFISNLFQQYTIDFLTIPAFLFQVGRQLGP